MGLPDLLDLAVLPDLLRKGGTSPVALLETCLARIAAVNGSINAVVALDRSGAERAAEHSAQRWRRDKPLSPIDGAPVLVKANYAVAGLPWHGGIPAYAHRISEHDAPVIQRLRQAGAVILGLTNMDEGALGASGDNAWLGRIANPRHPGLSAGGSSGGSAAAVAAGFCMAALGSDTIGSIAIPAAYCGIAGHRATRALMPIAGVMPLSPSFDHLGWHSRSICGALALRRALGSALALRETFNIAALAVEPGAIERTLPSGSRVASLAAPIDLRDVARRLFEVAEAEGAVVHVRALSERPDGFSPGFRRLLDWGATKGAARRDDHLAWLDGAAQALRTVLAGYDALVMPATPHKPQDAGSPVPDDQAMFAALPACLGWPATTIPAGEDGGAALLVTAKSDDMCLSIAARLQAG